MHDQKKDKDEALNTKLDEQKDAAVARKLKNEKNDRTDRLNKPAIEKSITSADSNNAGAMEPIGSATVTTDKIEIQSGTKKSGKVLGIVNARDRVSVIGRMGDELKILFEGKVGYISTSATDFAETAALECPVSAAPKTATVAVNVLNVRQSPSKDAPVIGTLRITDCVNVYAEIDGFLEIHIGDSTAYIAAEYTDYDDKYGQIQIGEDKREAIRSLLVKDFLTAEEIARLRKLARHLPKSERGDVLEAAQLKQQSDKAMNTEKDGYEVLASCLEYLGIDNPSNALSFAAYLEQLRHNQKLHETTGLQNWCAIANLMGISAQALMLPECQQGFEAEFWTQTIRDELRNGCAVMASFNHRPVRIVAVEADGVRMDNQIAEISEPLIPFEKLPTSGLQWVIGLNDSYL